MSYKENENQKETKDAASSEILCILIAAIDEELEAKCGDVKKMSMNVLQSQLTKTFIFEGLRRVLLGALIDVKERAQAKKDIDK